MYISTQLHMFFQYLISPKKSLVSVKGNGKGQNGIMY